MIRDQATELRNLARRAHRGSAVVEPGGPLVGVAGGHCGAGATSVAVGLAIGLAECGLRIVLADADLEHPHIAERCGVARSDARVPDVRDAIALDQDLRDVLVAGPLGLQIVPIHADRSAGRPELSAAACDRFVDRFRALGCHADGLFVDLGAGATPLATHLWRAADHLIIVLRPEDQSLMDAYARVKTIGRAERTTLHILVNGVSDERRARGVVARLAHACDRFLGVAVAFAGWRPASADRPVAPSDGGGFMPVEPSWSAEECGAMESIVGRWKAILETGRAEGPVDPWIGATDMEQPGGNPERT